MYQLIAISPKYSKTKMIYRQEFTTHLLPGRVRPLITAQILRYASMGKLKLTLTNHQGDQSFRHFVCMMVAARTVIHKKRNANNFFSLDPKSWNSRANCKSEKAKSKRVVPGTYKQGEPCAACPKPHTTPGTRTRPLPSPIPNLLDSVRTRGW